jgi:Lectin C-type domain
MWLAAIVMLCASCGFEVPSAGAPADDDASVTTDAAFDAPLDAPPDAGADAALAACPAAPGGCTGFTCATSTSCFYVCSNTHSYNAARDTCVSDNLGCLATVNDAAENACIVAHTVPAPVFPNLLWIGYVQAANATEPGGGWGWQCGSSTYVAANWGSFEPNDSGGNEDCGAVNEGGAWIDVACGTQLRYVCERPRP